MEYEEVKKTVDEVTILEFRLKKLSMMTPEDVLNSISCGETSLTINIGNSRVLLLQSAERLLEEAKKLMEYEISERKKKFIK